MAQRTGLEPATSAVTGRHSNQLNYRRTKNYTRTQVLKKYEIQGFQNGGRCRDRTCDIHLVRVALYQLS